ncbi:hypothetical protein [Clostridium thermobutyricum]|uniref:hypothetical protein n=1 Tax=Clostridium thermobutyricum TaxID=29372 RepID=UPI0029430ADA|nr:hypothetical protein [Clostridium thermobutyricum]
MGLGDIFKSNNKKKKKEKNNKIVQDLLNIKAIENKLILTDRYKYYLKIMPKNLSIYEYNDKLNIISRLKSAIDSIAIKDFEFFITDKAERLERNKEYIEKLIEENEGNELILDLLEDDLNYLTDISFSNNASREFFFIFYSKEKNPSLYSNVQRSFETNGFSTEIPTQNDLKNMLQVYFDRNFSNIVVKDFDI